MAESPWIAAVAALFLWWASTGVFLWRVAAADNAGGAQHRWSVIGGLPLLAGGFVAAQASLGMTGVAGAYLGFAAALAIWGWIELAFLSGVITGPNRSPCPPDARPAERLRRAIGTIAWHELTLIAALLALFALSRGAALPVAFWAFAVLFAARVSAKLNLFLGVPRINTAFLPSPLAHVPSHFRHSPASGFFPVSVVLLAVASAGWILLAAQAGDPAAAVGFSLLATLTLLALLEHGFMVLALPDDKLWRWMMPAPKKPPLETLREKTNGL